MQILKDPHLVVIILVVTGVAVLLLLLEAAVPQLRGTITLERDIENPTGQTVRSNNYNNCKRVSELIQDMYISKCVAIKKSRSVAVIFNSLLCNYILFPSLLYVQ